MTDALKNRNRFELIIFDLDGTLVDSAEDLAEALNYATLPLGHEPVSAATIKTLVGEGVSKLIDKVLYKNELEMKNEVAARFTDYYLHHITNHTRAYPHVPEILARMKDFKKAVISNKKEELSKKVLIDLNLIKYFDLVMGSDSAAERKPSPLPLITAAERLGVTPERCFMVGDSQFDMVAGKRAGMKTCGVTYGFRGKKILAESGADYLVDSFDEIPDLLVKR